MGRGHWIETPGGVGAALNLYDRIYAGKKAGWTNKKLTDERRRAAIASLRLALDQLESCSQTTICDEWADALSAADGHLEQARDDIERAFGGIDS